MSALSMDPTNIKGYFRKSQALMSISNYAEAMMAAQAGRQAALSQGKVPDVSSFLFNSPTLVVFTFKWIAVLENEGIEM